MKTLKYFFISYILFVCGFIINFIFICVNALAIFAGKDPALSFAGQINFFRYSFPILITGAVAFVWAYKAGKLDRIFK